MEKLGVEVKAPAARTSTAEGRRYLACRGCPMRATGCDGRHVRAPFVTQSLGGRRGERELGERR